MTAPRLALSLLDDGMTVRVERGEGVTDTDWLLMRAIWSADGVDVSRLIEFSLPSFLARLSLLVDKCRKLGLDLAPDEQITLRAQLARDARRNLRAAMDGSTAVVSEEEATDLLADSRFHPDEPLRDFQEHDLARLLTLRNGANFSVPGAGKTRVAYALYEAERERKRVTRLLIIAPLSAFDAWREEAEICFGSAVEPFVHERGPVPAGAEVVLTNYSRLSGSYANLAAWLSKAPAMLILDEAHRMKRGWAGEWGTHCLNLAYIAERRDILTGTPAPQGPGDLVALIDFLWPNEAVRVLPATALVPNPGPDAIKLVAAAISPLFVRTSKDQLELPEVTHRVVQVPLEGLQREIYQALRQVYAGEFAVTRRERLDLVALGRVTMYLLEAATNPRLLMAGSMEGADADVFRHPPLAVQPGSRLSELIAAYNQHETPRKFVELLRLVRDNVRAGHKTLIWSNFVRNLKLLEPMLAAYQPALVHGAVRPYSDDPKDRTRETELDRFRHDPACMVLIANPAAMSEGVSLHHACHDAIYLDRTFNAGQLIQSVDRIHRLGLEPTQETRITFLITEETIDEVVDARVEIKARRLGEMLNDPSLVEVVLPNDEDYGPPIEGDDDIAALFAHLRGGDA